MLGQTDRRIFLNITEGKIVKRLGQSVSVYDFIEGDLEKIFPKERVFRGEIVPYWYLDIRDPQTGELYSLGINASSGVWRSLILSICSVENFLLPIRIYPYRKGDYDKVSVYSGGKKLDWVSDLPPVEYVEVQGQTVKSTAKRDQYIQSLVDSVNYRLGVQTNGRTPVRTPPQERGIGQRKTQRGGGNYSSLFPLLEDKK